MTPGDASLRSLPTLPPGGGPTPAQIALRQTIIPICLTIGTIMLLLGALQWVGGITHPFARLGPVFAWLLPAMGLVLLAVALLNMVFVQRHLHPQPPASN